MYDRKMLRNNSAEFQHALSVYDKAVAEMTHETYTRISDDWLIELSAIFGERYLAELGVCAARGQDVDVVKKTNRMFNAAHVVRGINGAFYETVERSAERRRRVDDRTLAAMDVDLQALVANV